MSDHGLPPDPAHDPIDKAYVEAEALLSDDAARAARRARVLAAVAHEQATPADQSSPSSSRSSWRGGWQRGGWLVAASVAGLALFVAIYRPTPIPPQPATAPTAAVSSVARSGDAVSSAPSVEMAPQAPPEPRAKAAMAAPAPGASPPPSRGGPVEQAPILPTAPPPDAFPARALPPPATAPSPPPPPPPPPPSESTEATSVGAVVVTSQRRASADAVKPPPVASQSDKFGAVGGLLSDQAARLRAAAAAGRTADIEALLAQGVPVDAADAAGDTALMASIQSDHPSAAAALRRHGASLDHKNHAGESARDMAAERGDAALDQAIGLGP